MSAIRPQSAFSTAAHFHRAAGRDDTPTETPLLVRRPAREVIQFAAGSAVASATMAVAAVLPPSTTTALFAYPLAAALAVIHSADNKLSETRGAPRAVDEPCVRHDDGKVETQKSFNMRSLMRGTGVSRRNDDFEP